MNRERKNQMVNYQNIDLRKIKLFLKIATQHTFTETAKEFNMSVPAVSKQITQFESLMGARLFYRSTKNTEMTSSGKFCYNFFKNFDQSYEDFVVERDKVFELFIPPRPVAVW